MGADVKHIGNLKSSKEFKEHIRLVSSSGDVNVSKLYEGSAYLLPGCRVYKGSRQTPLLPIGKDNSCHYFVGPPDVSDGVYFKMFIDGLRNSVASLQRLLHVPDEFVSGCNVMDILKAENDGDPLIENIAECYRGLAMANQIWSDCSDLTTNEMKFVIAEYDDLVGFMKNPYRVASSSKARFELFDKLAIKYNVDMATRCNYNVKNVLHNFMYEEGHACYPENQLKEIVKAKMRISSQADTSILDDIVKSRFPHYKKYVYLRSGYAQEQAIASYIRFLSEPKKSKRLITQTQFEEFIADYVREHHALNAKQIKAVERVFVGESDVSIVTGFPGTGKSCVAGCIRFICECAGLSVLMCAPTGKAANKLGKEGMTIHRALDCKYMQE